MNNYSKVSKHKSTCISKLKCWRNNLNLSNIRSISSEIAKRDQWNFICLSDNYFRRFLTVFRYLTAISISNLSNNKDQNVGQDHQFQIIYSKL